jgi:hypothetical protein
MKGSEAKDVKAHTHNLSEERKFSYRIHSTCVASDNCFFDQTMSLLPATDRTKCTQLFFKETFQVLTFFTGLWS